MVTNINYQLLLLVTHGIKEWQSSDSQWHNGVRELCNEDRKDEMWITAAEIIGRIVGNWEEICPGPTAG